MEPDPVGSPPHQPDQRHETPPPSYEEATAPLTNNQGAYASQKPAHRHENPPRNSQHQPIAEGGSLIAATAGSSSAAGVEASRSRPSAIENIIKAHRERKQEKQARKKVDFYEKLYGFVPKNVMTEAEWKRVREAAPKTKVPFRAKPYWGSMG